MNEFRIQVMVPQHDSSEMRVPVFSNHTSQSESVISSGTFFFDSFRGSFFHSRQVRTTHGMLLLVHQFVNIERLSVGIYSSSNDLLQKGDKEMHIAAVVSLEFVKQG